MGGPGSGNRLRFGRRDTCEASYRVDIRYMRKAGLLRKGSIGTLSWSRGGEQTGWIRYRVYPNSLELDYKTRTNGGEWKSVNEFVPLVQQPQPFGGNRLYLRCPACERLCLVLYGGARFRCRQCQGLAYASQQENAIGRLCGRSERIRQRLGDAGGFDDPFPPRPKGMHAKTYLRLRSEGETLENRIGFVMDGLIRSLSNHG